MTFGFTILSIVLCGIFLLLFGNASLAIIFGVGLGVLFRCLYLLNEINDKLSKINPKTDRVQEENENNA
ncbi:hypothetical protein [Cytobacillus sp. IB215665]|uniref:hypothetical protein n=1 Tax=Cytobacillus sp. IB215665 TaxID=3097357 RepID=UPI002A144FCB|nr:hypothetical protein [Cytobacillus sp. IB215665]MDX8366720.1 hypothetical protein [Cytobacillus sp. IB215665]